MAKPFDPISLDSRVSYRTNSANVLADLPYNCWRVFPLFNLSCRGDFTSFAIAVVVPNRENKCEDDEGEDGEDARKESTVGTAR